MEPVRSFCKDSLAVRIYADRTAMGAAAARDGAALLRRLLAQQDTVRAVFAAAPSQNEFLEALCAAPDIDWKRVTAFHMDEYVGLDAAAPQGFGNFLRARVFDRLPFGQVCYLNGNAPDVEAECSRYAGLLAQAPIDIVFMGIGENGHIAFNDPPVAEFDDPAAVKVVALDEVCRNQQVHDGCFADIGQVPTHALTLTVPTLAGAKHHPVSYTHLPLWRPVPAVPRGSCAASVPVMRQAWWAAAWWCRDGHEPRSRPGSVRAWRP